MASKKRIADFDEQLWPINCAIVILGGLLAGFIMAKSSPADPRLIGNRWVGLASVGLLMIVLLAGVRWLRGKMRRRLQLGIVVSLLVHTTALLLLAHGGVAQPGRSVLARQLGVPDEQSLPERFRSQDLDTAADQTPIYQQPVETEAVENPGPTTVEYPQPARETPVAEKEPAEPEPAGGRPLGAQVIARAALSAPRGAELAGGDQLSRQHLEQPLPGEPIPLPEIKAGGQEGAAAVPARAAAVQRQETAPATPQRRLYSEPESKPLRAALQLARLDAQPAPRHDAPGPPLPARELAHAGEILYSEAAASDPVNGAGRLPAAALQPAPTMVDRQLTAALPPAAASVEQNAAGDPLGKTSATAGAAEAGLGSGAVASLPSGRRPPAMAAIAAAGNMANMGLAGGGSPLARSANSSAVGATVDTTAEGDWAASGGPAGAAVGPGTGAGGQLGPAAVAASIVAPQHQAAGLPGNFQGPRRLEGAAVAGPLATAPGIVAGPQRLRQGGGGGSAPIAAAPGDGPLGKSDSSGLLRGLGEAVQSQSVAGAGAGPGTGAPQPGAGQDLAVGSGVGEPGRQGGGLPVLMAAPRGSGGPDYDPTPAVGVPGRFARPQGTAVSMLSPRSLSEPGGGGLARHSGGPAIDGTVSEATEGYRNRAGGNRRKGLKTGGGEGTEIAVERGLDFFARLQFPDGHWSLHELPPGVKLDDAALGQMQSDTAATGLVLLTYLGGGYTHLDDKHRAVVRKGVDWLIRRQKPNGDLFNGGTKYAWFYSHGIAAIALCEAYGMTQDPELREPARKAIDFIVKSQNPTRGGWRYDVDADTGRASETDTSVTGWQLMALKSAQMAGLEVPAETFRKIDAWLGYAAAPDVAGRYVYNPFARPTPEQQQGREPSLAMTAEALLMRMYLGHKRQDPQLIECAEYLKANLPDIGTSERPLRDCYYWYYATQAMFQMQGRYWTAWNERLRPLLQRSQVPSGQLAGSWHPQEPVRDRWGAAGGRLYVTAMHLLMLEVYYRHLPLFRLD